MNKRTGFCEGIKMWMKEFLRESILAFLGAIGTLGGGGYEGDIAWGIFGVPVLLLFCIGCYQIIKWFCNMIYEIRARNQKRKKK